MDVELVSALHVLHLVNVIHRNSQNVLSASLRVLVLGHNLQVKLILVVLVSDEPNRQVLVVLDGLHTLTTNFLSRVVCMETVFDH